MQWKNGELKKNKKIKWESEKPENEKNGKPKKTNVVIYKWSSNVF